MIDSIRWVCECGKEHETMIFCTKSTLRCERCLRTYSASYEGPVIREVTGPMKEVKKDVYLR